MPAFDPFKMKITERDCPRCDDGRLQTERIGDLKVNLYCDTCNYSHIYVRKAASRQAAVTTAPTPPPPTKDDSMSKQKPTGLDKKQYQRWYTCGQPDIDAFKNAGCPTAAKWKKQQAGEVDPPQAKAKVKSKRRKKKLGKQPEAKELPAVGKIINGTPLLLSPPKLTKVRFLYIESEGEPGDGLKPLLDLLKSFVS